MLASLISLLSAHLKMEAHAPAGRIMRTGLFVLVLTCYLFLRLTRKTTFSKDLKAAIAAFIFIGTFTFPLIFFILMRSSETMEPSVFIYSITSFLLGFMAYLFIIVFFTDLFQILLNMLKIPIKFIALIVKRPIQRDGLSDESRKKFNTYRSIAMIGIAFILFIIGYIQALNQPNVEKRTVEIGSNPVPAKHLRIAHMSDIHLNPLLDGKWLDGIVENVKKAEPDIVVITGDFADGHARHYKNYLNLFKNVNAPIYFITGNHEFLWGKDDWIDAFREAGITVLDNRRIYIDINGVKVLLAGIQDSGGGPWRFTPPAGFDKLLQDDKDSDIRILLSHRPEIFPAAAEAGFDLVLAGHTHNGQTFPFNIFAKLVTPYPVGFYKIGKSILFTSPGAGYVGPPLRLFVPKEITILDINIRK